MKVVFLYYINRSGSTYLCQQLSRMNEILVCPEAEILVDKLLISPLSTISNNLKELITELKLDKKLNEWGLTIQTIEPAETNYELFKNILHRYRERVKPNARIIVFKAERLFQLHDKLKALRQIGEDIDFISLLRDVRAVYNSQSNSIVPEIGQVFSKNPVASAMYWNWFVKKYLKNKSDFSAFVNYETLITEFPEPIYALLNEISVNKNEFDLLQGDLHQRIPGSHKQLHGNILHSPLTKRINAWKKELSQREIQLIEICSKKYLRALNYNFVTTKQFNLLYAFCQIQKARFILHLLLRKIRNKLMGLLNDRN